MVADVSGAHRTILSVHGLLHLWGLTVCILNHCSSWSRMEAMGTLSHPEGHPLLGAPAVVATAEVSTSCLVPPPLSPGVTVSLRCTGHPRPALTGLLASQQETGPTFGVPRTTHRFGWPRAARTQWDWHAEGHRELGKKMSLSCPLPVPSG